MVNSLNDLIVCHSIAKTRPTVEEYFLLMARLISTRATCMKNRVGCVLVNKQNRVLSTGYNGSARGLPHCIDTPCEGWEENGACSAIHAEQNGLIQCPDTDKIHTVYCTTAPCPRCLKLFLNTTCKRIIFLDQNRHADRSEALWTQVTGNVWWWYDIKASTGHSSKPLASAERAVADQAKEFTFKKEQGIIEEPANPQPSGRLVTIVGEPINTEVPVNYFGGCQTCSYFIAPFFCSLPSTSGESGLSQERVNSGCGHRRERVVNAT